MGETLHLEAQHSPRGCIRPLPNNTTLSGKGGWGFGVEGLRFRVAKALSLTFLGAAGSQVPASPSGRTSCNLRSASSKNSAEALMGALNPKP